MYLPCCCQLGWGMLVCPGRLDPVLPVLRINACLTQAVLKDVAFSRWVFLLCAPNGDIALLFCGRVHQVLPAHRVQSVSLAQLWVLSPVGRNPPCCHNLSSEALQRLAVSAWYCWCPTHEQDIAARCDRRWWGWSFASALCLCQVVWDSFLLGCRWGARSKGTARPLWSERWWRTPRFPWSPRPSGLAGNL